MALIDDVLRYTRDARENPAGAVSGEAIDRLEDAAGRAFDGSFETRTSPVAPLTWMGRSVLLKSQDQTKLNPIALGEPLLITGVHTSILMIDTDAGAVKPPIEALDVAFEINRREFLTSQAESKAVAGRDRQVVSLASIDATIANRLLGLILQPTDPVLSYRFFWATDQATRTAFNWGSVQISLNFFVRPVNQEGHGFKV